MRINNNLMAMNTHRQLGINNTMTAKSLEKLSSGFRINRAGDDAAGLAISEKMRAQVRGLNQASRNAQDGISLIQTAEGALQESQAILQRMRELAVQSANDTNVAVDRGEIQKEIDQLSQELTRIADTTEFNTQNLLGGKFSAKFHIGANEGQDVDLSISEMTANSLGVNGKVYTAVGVTGVDGLQVKSVNGEEVTITYADALTAAEQGSGAGAITETTAKFDTATNTITITLKQEAASAGGTNAGAIADTHGGIQAAIEAIASEAGIEVTASATTDTTAVTTAPADTTVTAVVDTAATELSTTGINVSTQKNASGAITTINKAIESVSAERSKLGAMQNRLEHTIKNLDTSAENLQASESRIRDVDMAKEMMEFTKQNILAQAATAMLAQANQAPQGVLQLLR